jgi:hypothetical protein
MAHARAEGTRVRLAIELFVTEVWVSDAVGVAVALFVPGADRVGTLAWL